MLGQVPYEIDFQLLGIPVIDLPIAVKVNGVMPTPTREAIKYSDKAIQIIKESIKLAATELVELYNKKTTELDDWKEWLRVKEESPYVQLGENKIYLYPIEQYSTIEAKKPVFLPLKNNNTKSLNQWNLFPFYCVAKIQNGRKTQLDKNYIEVSDNCYRISDNFVSRKNSYIGTLTDNIFIVRRKKLKLKDYRILLKLQWDERDTWRDKIKEYQTFVDKQWNSIKSYDDIVIPKGWNKKAYSRSADVTIYKLREKRIRDYNCPTMGESSHVKEFNHKHLCIYGEREDHPTLDKIWRVAPKDIKLFFMAKSNMKYVEDAHQYVHVENWKKTKAFSRVVTAWKIKQLFKKYYSILQIDSSGNLSYRPNIYMNLCLLSTEFKDLSESLREYRVKNLRTTHFDSDAFMEECIKVADAQRLWDYRVYYDITRLEKLCKAFEFVKVFKPDEDWTNIAANYIKKVTKEVRLDLKHYVKNK